MFKFIPLTMLKKRQDNSSRRPQANAFGIFGAAQAATLPSSVDLSLDNWPPIYNQNVIGSCTANALCSNIRYLARNKSFEPSRLFVYYMERLNECKGDHSAIYDSGATIDYACQYSEEVGVCEEHMWPYDIMNVNIQPPQACIDNARSYKVGRCFNISLNFGCMLKTIKYLLRMHLPVLYAFGVYASFMLTGAASGRPSMPNPIVYEDGNDARDPFLGGHEVLIVGYDDTTQLFKLVNSWGEEWGEKGFF